MRGSGIGVSWVWVSVPLVMALVGCGGSEQKAATSASRSSADWMCGSPDQCAEEVGRYPTDPRLRTQYARVLTRSGRLGAAAKEYRAAMKLSDDDPSVIEEAARGLATLGDPDGCLAELDAMVNEGGTHREAKKEAAIRARAYCKRPGH